MAVDMFLKIAGVNGEAQDATHKQEIDILAWSWGVANSGTTHVGGGGGAGKAMFQDLSVTKWVDLSSNAIMEACATGKHFTDGTLTVRKAGGTPLEYIIIEMSEIMIAAVSTGGSGGEDRLTENVVLNFAKFKFNYTEQTATGAAGQKGKTGYDIPANKLWT